MPDPASRTPGTGGGGASRRRLPASERRVVILDAALKTFASNGYDGTSMDQIAAAAGISKAVVYDHVASKRELYLQLLDAIRVDLELAVERALEPAGGPGEARVRIGVAAFFQYVEDHPDASRLLLVELQSANISPLGRQLEERMTAGIAQTLGDDPVLLAGHPQRTRQLRILAELLKSAVHGLALWWYRHPQMPREELIERAVGVVWPAIARARAG